MKKALFRLGIGISLLLAITFMAPHNTMSVAAKTKNVTSSMKNKSGIKNLCKFANMYVQVEVEWNYTKKESKSP